MLNFKEEISDIKKSDFLMYLFFIMISFCKGIGLSSSDKVYIFIFLFGALTVGIKMFQDKFTVNEIANLFFILGIGI